VPAGFVTADASEHDFVQIWRRTAHAIARDQSGNFWTWGENLAGNLGLGDTTPRNTPTPFPLPAGVTSFDSIYLGGQFTIARDQSGSLWTWGRNTTGELGFGDTTPRNTPTPFPLPAGVTSFDSVYPGSQHTIARDQDGNLWSWGFNSVGQLGLGDFEHRNTPTPFPLPAGVTSFDSIHVGWHNTLAFDQDGNPWVWGNNAGRQLGLDDFEHRNTPTPLPLPAGVTSFDSIYMGWTSMMARDQSGNLWAWGSNSVGQLGFGEEEGVGIPTPFPLPAGVTSFDFIHADITQSHFIATDQNGNLWIWGANAHGQLGLGDFARRNTPTLFPLPAGVISFEYVATAGHANLARDQNGDIWAWGQNHWGQLGLGANTDVYVNTPTRLTDVRAIPRVQIVNATPAPAATGVSIDLNQVVVTFDTPMDPTAGSIAINRDATVNMAGAVWSAGNTVVTIPVELDEDAFLAVHTITATGFIAAAGDLILRQTVWNFRTEVEPFDPPAGTLHKTLQAPAGTTLPATSNFVFNFEAVTIDLGSGVMSRGGHPTIAEAARTVTVDGTTATTSGSVVSADASLNLLNLFNTVFNSASLPAGTYVWNVSEVAGSSTHPGMEYDTSRFQVRVLVGNTGQIGAIEIYQWVYTPGLEGAAGTWALPADAPKLEAMSFVNIYIEETNLEVTKTITNREFANLETLFRFDLTLTAPNMTLLPASIEAFIYSGATRITDTTRSPVTITNGSGTFDLRDGERIVIPDLPVGTTFIVSEQAHAEFAPSVSVESNGSVVHTAVGTTNSALNTGHHLITGTARNAADFTNEHNFVPPTGLVIANTPIALVAALLVGLVLLLASRKRRAIETLPVAY